MQPDEPAPQPPACGNAMPRDEVYRAAHAAFLNEHTRWNSWGLFFFGILAALIAGCDHLPEGFPLFLVYLLASVISFLWLLVVIAMRRSTSCWVEVLRGIESGTCATPFQSFKHFSEKHRVWDDVKGLFSGEVGGEGARAKTDWVCVRSVTGILGLLAIVMLIVFVAMTVWQCVDWLHGKEPVIFVV